jgi:hypothetical protein
MNQKQLEGAVRRMWGDKNLEPARKSYLMQHIMASRYIVAQQQHKLGVSSESAETAQQSGAFHCTHTDRWAIAGAVRGMRADAHITSTCCFGQPIRQLSSVVPACFFVHALQKQLGLSIHFIAAAACWGAATMHGAQRSWRPAAVAFSPAVVATTRRRITCWTLRPCRRWRACTAASSSLWQVSLERQARWNVSFGSWLPMAVTPHSVSHLAGECNGCGEKLAAYFCGICRLWDDVPGRQVSPWMQYCTSMQLQYCTSMQLQASYLGPKAWPLHLLVLSHAHRLHADIPLSLLQPVPPRRRARPGCMPLHAVQLLHASVRVCAPQVPGPVHVPCVHRVPLRQQPALQGAHYMCQDEVAWSSMFD